MTIEGPIPWSSDKVAQLGNVGREAIVMSHEGSCTCGNVRFELTAEPMIVHACHCTQCQRVTGSAFVINAVVEKAAVALLSGAPRAAHFEGTRHTAYFCDDCGTYVWSEYAGGLGACWFVRVGTLNDPGSCPPDVHIFTSTKQAWVVLPEGVPQFDEFYDLKSVWPKAALDRLRAASQAG